MRLAAPAEWIADLILSALDDLARRSPPPTARPEPPMRILRHSDYGAQDRVGHAESPTPALASIMPHPLPWSPTVPYPAGTVPTPGNLVYRCRLCAAVFDAYPVGDAVGTLNALVIAGNAFVASKDAPDRLALTFAHACQDGRHGVADVVGMATGTRPADVPS